MAQHPEAPREPAASAEVAQSTEPRAAAETDQAPGQPPRSIVLIGAGQAHLSVLRAWGRAPIPQHRLTLVTATDRALHSPRLASVLAGQMPLTAALIDLPKLCNAVNVQLIVDRCVRLDPQSQTIDLAHQPTIGFDVASINLGSIPAGESWVQHHRTLVSIKPMATFVRRFEARLAELRQQRLDLGTKEPWSLAIVGGGAAGIELSLCLEARLRRESQGVRVQLVTASGLWPGASESAQRRAQRLLKQRGIEVHGGVEVIACDEDGPPSLELADGRRLPCDLAVWATGPSPAACLSQLRLPVSDRGFLLVRPTLQTTADVPVFVAGDAADWPDVELPKSSANAVRQAAVLWSNLQHWCRNEPLVTHRPHQRRSGLLDCGDGTALWDYAGWSGRGRLAWWLKQTRDRRFAQFIQG